LDFNRRKAQHGSFIHILQAEAKEVFNYLATSFEVNCLLSYRESGTQLTWERDKWVQNFCTQHKIEWIQFQRDGIQRGIQHRKDWEKRWFEAITAKPFQNEIAQNCLQVEHPFIMDADFQLSLQSYPKSFQPAGESYAWRYLNSFVLDRGAQYHKFISKPAESRKSCSRLSPYLAWGNLSIRQVYQYVKGHEAFARNKFAFEGMLTRLRWHCHFIQKFEMECSYETLCINKGYEALQHTNRADFLLAWKEGRTGFPLAQLFLDYEPGIHYPQFQMQAGTTGINTIRMYNPIKQSIEHDTKGVFIKAWVAELKNVHENFIHEPWKMTILEQELYGVKLGMEYPFPIVDIETAGSLARDKIWGHRNHPLVQAESKRIVLKHTSIRNRMK
jgi:deoxyribodipyrimidine photo-lyase